MKLKPETSSVLPNRNDDRREITQRDSRVKLSIMLHQSDNEKARGKVIQRDWAHASISGCWLEMTDSSVRELPIRLGGQPSAPSLSLNQLALKASHHRVWNLGSPQEKEGTLQLFD